MKPTQLYPRKQEFTEGSRMIKEHFGEEADVIFLAELKSAVEYFKQEQNKLNKKWSEQKMDMPNYIAEIELLLIKSFGDEA